uniref:Uncharacterized protein n=1 Tax=Anguilla anguilla TaxID=7936 RepID=A0A0E9XX91_ANGAN
MDKELDDMGYLLEEIANLTKGAQDKVVYMRDSANQAQKSIPQITISKGHRTCWMIF